MSDLTIYDVSVTYQSKLGQLGCMCTASHKVEGAEQRDMVLKWLRSKGLEPTWQVYHAMRAADCMKAFARQFGDFTIDMVPNRTKDPIDIGAV